MGEEKGNEREKEGGTETNTIQEWRRRNTRIFMCAVIVSF